MSVGDGSEPTCLVLHTACVPCSFPNNRFRRNVDIPMAKCLAGGPCFTQINRCQICCFTHTLIPRSSLVRACRLHAFANRAPRNCIFRPEPAAHWPRTTATSCQLNAAFSVFVDRPPFFFFWYIRSIIVSLGSHEARMGNRLLLVLREVAHRQHLFPVKQTYRPSFFTVGSRRDHLAAQRRPLFSDSMPTNPSSQPGRKHPMRRRRCSHGQYEADDSELPLGNGGESQTIGSWKQSAGRRKMKPSVVLPWMASVKVRYNEKGLSFRGSALLRAKVPLPPFGYHATVQRLLL